MNLGKTYAKLRIFPKIFCKSGPWCLGEANKHALQKIFEFISLKMVYFSTFYAQYV